MGGAGKRLTRFLEQANIRRVMRKLAVPMILAIVSLASCKQEVGTRATPLVSRAIEQSNHEGNEIKAGDLTRMEQSLARIAARQKKLNYLLQRMIVRQDVLTHAVVRNARKQQNDRTLITGLRNDLEFDAGKLESISSVVKKMIDPMVKLQTALADLKIKFLQLQHKQNELAALTPVAMPVAANVPGKTTTAKPAPGMHNKKQKKVMESVG